MEWTRSRHCINIRVNRANLQPIPRDYLQGCRPLAGRAFNRIRANPTFTTLTFWINRISIIKIKFKISIQRELNLRGRISKPRQIVIIRAVRKSTDKTRNYKVWKPSLAIPASTRLRTPTPWSKSSRELSKPGSHKISLSIRSTYSNNWTVMRSTTNSCKFSKRGRLSTVKWSKRRHQAVTRRPCWRTRCNSSKRTRVQSQWFVITKTRSWAVHSWPSAPCTTTWKVIRTKSRWASSNRIINRMCSSRTSRLAGNSSTSSTFHSSSTAMPTPFKIIITSSNSNSMLWIKAKRKLATRETRYSNQVLAAAWIQRTQTISCCPAAALVATDDWRHREASIQTMLERSPRMRWNSRWIRAFSSPPTSTTASTALDKISRFRAVIIARSPPARDRTGRAALAAALLPASAWALTRRKWTKRKHKTCQARSKITTTCRRTTLAAKVIKVRSAWTIWIWEVGPTNKTHSKSSTITAFTGRMLVRVPP